MGCGASRLDDNGVVIPIKARPLFLLRIEEIKRRRHPQALKDTTPSKKELLLEDREEDENASTNKLLFNKAAAAGKESSLQEETGSCVTPEGSKGGSPPERPMKEYSDKMEDDKKKEVNSEELSRTNEQGRRIEPLAKEKAKVEHIMDGDIKNEEEEDDDDDDDGRMLRQHEDDEAFPGSPSFRVYFVDNMKDNKNKGLDDHLTDMAQSDDDPIPIPSKISVPKEVKKAKKKRSFKKVLPTGKQAKNLFNVRACISSHSNHDRTHLLTAKAHA